VARRSDSTAPHPFRLTMAGRAVAAVATPALGASVPGVAVMSGVIRCACTPV
jgi:hypothetical protein